MGRVFSLSAHVVRCHQNTHTDGWKWALAPGRSEAAEGGRCPNDGQSITPCELMAPGHCHRSLTKQWPHACICCSASGVKRIVTYRANKSGIMHIGFEKSGWMLGGKYFDLVLIDCGSGVRWWRFSGRFAPPIDQHSTSIDGCQNCGEFSALGRCYVYTMAALPIRWAVWSVNNAMSESRTHTQSWSRYVYGPLTHLGRRFSTAVRLVIISTRSCVSVWLGRLVDFQQSNRRAHFEFASGIFQCVAVATALEYWLGSLNSCSKVWTEHANFHCSPIEYVRWSGQTAGPAVLPMC